MKCKESKYRTLSFLDLTFLGIGSSLGVGIFVLLGDLTRNDAGPAVVVSIVLAGLAAILIGLCLAEFGTRFVKADTAYSYSYSYHGENVAFIFGWALILEFIAGTASVAKGILTFVDALTENEISGFMKKVVPLEPEFGIPYLDFFTPIIIVVVLGFVLVLGLKDSRLIINLFTTCTVILLLSIIIAGSTKADLANWGATDYNFTDFEKSFAPFGYLGILKGAAVGFYGYIGFDTIGVTGREVNNPQVCIPFANQIAVCVIMVLYAGSAVVLTLITPYSTHVLGAALPLAFEKIQWITFKWIMVGGSFFGFYTSLIGAPFALFRVVNAMANDGLLFQCLGNGYYSGKAPVLAMISGTLLSVTAAGLFNFEALVKMTNISALFACTIIAIDVIMLRYVPDDGTTRNVSDGTVSPSVPKVDASLSQLLKLFFRFTSITPTKLTEKIVVINLVIYCAASIGLAAVFILFSDYLMNVAAEAIVPAVLLLALMLTSVASISCQPKSHMSTPFKVPLIPIVPCLSMFINIVLVMMLDTLAIVHFVIWMAAGILPHFLWYGIKYLRGDIGNSLYEINKLNTIKLNESIWKINTDKKSFYEGAINPVFQDDNGEETFADSNGLTEKEASSIQEVILVKTEERYETMASIDGKKEEKECEKEETEHINENEGHWKCVAEVHTEKDSPNGSYEVEVVNKTYNFLSDMTEDFSRDEASSTSSGPAARVLSDRNPSTGSGDSFKSTTIEAAEKATETLKIVDDLRTSTPESTNSEPISTTVEKEKEEKEDGKKGKRRRKRKSHASESSEMAENDDRAKAFKDKLNILLKNQINTTNPFKDAMLNYEEEVGDEEKTESTPKNIKTLNKSQMKDTLEILLAKGPPKRYSLRNSFHIGMTETSTEESHR